MMLVLVFTTQGPKKLHPLDCGSNANSCTAPGNSSGSHANAATCTRASCIQRSSLWLRWHGCCQLIVTAIPFMQSKIARPRNAQGNVFMIRGNHHQSSTSESATGVRTARGTRVLPAGGKEKEEAQEGPRGYQSPVRTAVLTIRTRASPILPLSLLLPLLLALVLGSATRAQFRSLFVAGPLALQPLL